MLFLVSCCSFYSPGVVDLKENPMTKINCWEFNGCGRASNGPTALEFGVCPATIEARLHGMNDGVNSGRVCWAIAGTLCKGQVQGTFISKVVDCMHCDFFKLVVREQGTTFRETSEIFEKLMPSDRQNL
jgi:hypothetical protein